jgi:hypothetical protein
MVGGARDLTILALRSELLPRGSFPLAQTVGSTCRAE